MKKLLFLLFLVNQAWAQSADSLSIHNRALSPIEMKQDLELFVDIQKKANSGLYRYHSVKQVDSLYKWAFKQAQHPMPKLEFYKIILQLMDFEGSCHNYSEPDAALVGYYNKQRGFFPYALKYIEGNMIFNGKIPQIPVGSKVISINGVPDKKLMQSFYKYSTADGFTKTQKLSSSVDKSYGLRYLYEYGIKDKFTIQFLAPGARKPQTVTIPAVSLEERKANLLLKHSASVDSIIDHNVQPKYSFKMLNPKTGLLNLRIFSMAYGPEDPAFPIYVSFIDSVFQTLSKNNIPNLILDLRGNPGGSDPNFEQPMMYLTDSSFKENNLAYTIFDDGVPYEKYFWGISTSERMDSAAKESGKLMLKDYFPGLVNGRNLQNVKYNPVYYPKQPGFKGQLYLLIDENVASAASHLASLVKAYARKVEIVGVETVGGYYAHNGHMSLIYELPNSKIKTKFSIVYVDQDAPEKPDQPIGRGIIPDHTVWPAFSDFMENRDTQMEYVLKLIDGKH